MKKRCWFWHLWPEGNLDGRREAIRCLRCNKVLVALCDNCGRTHDTRGTLLIVCTVTRRSYE